MLHGMEKTDSGLPPPEDEGDAFEVSASGEGVGLKFPSGTGGGVITPVEAARLGFALLNGAHPEPVGTEEQFVGDLEAKADYQRRVQLEREAEDA